MYSDKKNKHRQSKSHHPKIKKPKVVIKQRANLPGPGEYPIKGQFENLVDQEINKQEKVKEYINSKIVKTEISDTIKFLYDTWDSRKFPVFRSNFSHSLEMPFCGEVMSFLMTHGFM